MCGECPPNPPPPRGMAAALHAAAIRSAKVPAPIPLRNMTRHPGITPLPLPLPSNALVPLLVAIFQRRGTLADLNVLPETVAPSDLLLGGERRLVDPGGALVAIAVDHDVVELHAVGAFEVGGGAGRLLEPLRAHGG